MDKIKEVENSFNHTVQINERKNLIITGVKKVENFSEEEFFIETVMGYILIKGEGLQLLKLDTFQGTISIKGKPESLNYIEESNKKQKSESIVSKLFK